MGRPEKVQARKIAKIRAIIVPVHVGNHPRNVKNRVEKNPTIGITVIACLPLVAERATKTTPTVKIRAEIVPASPTVTFMKLAISVKY
jgi:hypothetical protein